MNHSYTTETSLYILVLSSLSKSTQYKEESKRQQYCYSNSPRSNNSSSNYRCYNGWCNLLQKKIGNERYTEIFIKFYVKDHIILPPCYSRLQLSHAPTTSHVSSSN